VRHPVETAEEAISKARTAAAAGTAVGTAVAGTVVRRVRGGAGEAKEKAADTAKETADKAVGAVKDPAGTAKETVAKAADVAKTTTAKAGDAAKATTAKAGDATKSTAGKAGDTAKTAKKAPAKKSTAKKAPAKKAAPVREPQLVLPEPAPPELPPIDVVGEALAAEAEGDTVGAGRTTEPRGASRDEEHGDAALQRAEAEEIAEEMVEMTEAGNLDIDTPVHTTGADVAFNPDTAEADLQQPGTEPLLDPSLTKAVKAEQETLSEAAEPRKPRPRKKKNS